MKNLRAKLVQVALEWEGAFGVAPQVTAALSEFDAAMLVGYDPASYSQDMQGITAVRRGFDFEFRKLRYQVKANRPSGKSGSKVTLVPKVTNYEWNYLIWILYNEHYEVMEAWQWEVGAYRTAFEAVKRISPKHMRRGMRIDAGCI